MASIKEIKDRMASIRDTLKITNAMYMISSSKLTKAKAGLEATEPYFYTLQYTMARILRHLPDINSPYFEDEDLKTPEEKKTGYIVITADKGLAGSYNHNVIKLTEENLKGPGSSELFVLGELGRAYFEKERSLVDKDFRYTVQNPTLGRARAISEIVLDSYLTGKVDEVDIIYTSMENSMTYEAKKQRLLPMRREAINRAVPSGIFLENLSFHPSPEKVLSQVVPDYVVGFVYSALVESFCSEQNARMMAMESATKSGQDMLHELDTLYNRARQAAITQEITEVCAGAKAQKTKKRT